MSDTKDNTTPAEPRQKRAYRRKKGEHHVAFTEEVIADLPVSANHMDFWYDANAPYLTARRMSADKPAEFIFRFTPSQRAANLALLGVKLPTYQKIGVVSLANARKSAEEIWVEMSALEGRWRRTQEQIPTGDQLSKEPLELNKAAAENPDYERLMDTLMAAYQQATEGKGKERHSRGLSFEDQDMLQLLRRAGIGFGIGQACKKALEAQHRTMGESREELLGAIVYLAGTVIYLDEVIAKLGPDK